MSINEKHLKRNDVYILLNNVHVESPTLTHFLLSITVPEHFLLFLHFLLILWIFARNLSVGSFRQHTVFKFNKQFLNRISNHHSLFSFSLNHRLIFITYIKYTKSLQIVWFDGTLYPSGFKSKVVDCSRRYTWLPMIKEKIFLFESELQN